MNKSSYITTDPRNTSQIRTVIYSVCKFYNTYSARGVFLHWMNEYPYGCLSHSIPLNEDKEQENWKKTSVQSQEGKEDAYWGSLRFKVVQNPLRTLEFGLISAIFPNCKQR